MTRSGSSRARGAAGKRQLTDLRYAIRFLWTHKAFTAAAILTLAIGLGANTALYGMLNATLRPLPLPDQSNSSSLPRNRKGTRPADFSSPFPPNN